MVEEDKTKQALEYPACQGYFLTKDENDKYRPWQIEKYEATKVTEPGKIPFVERQVWFVDFQYYQSHEPKIYPKEFSIMNDTTGGLYQFITIGPKDVEPTSDHERNTFNMQFRMHKTAWNAGTVGNWEIKLETIVPKKGTLVYMKGLVKANFLRGHGWDKVVDLDTEVTLEQKSLTVLYKQYKHKKFDKCDFHAYNRGLCSLANVQLLRYWYRDELTEPFDKKLVINDQKVVFGGAFGIPDNESVKKARIDERTKHVVFTETKNCAYDLFK
jgi:hypothetical protein